MATETDNTVTVLDHIDNITVPGKVFHEPANEYWALVCMRHGMEFLYHQAHRCDQLAKEQVKPDDDVRFSGSGSFPAFNQIPQALLTCGFHWYAISACQYVRTVGAIARKHDPNRPLPNEYAESVVPEIIAFRDKVAAHFAWATKNKRDNDAERLASILPPLRFNHDSFYVGDLTVAMRRGGRASDSQAIQPWSLCKAHESLRERYWPELVNSTGDPNAEQPTDEREPE